MGKGHKRRNPPQLRRNTKPTTGQREFINVVYMEKENVFDPETEETKKQIYATCTCEKWRSSPEATTINKVAMEAKAHVEASEGKCQLRQHDPYEPENTTADPLSEGAILP
jgi:hypothetical protein